MKKTYFFLVLLIILIGFYLRTVGLELSPPSLGFDEAALGYNAYSLLKTARDEYGNYLPLSLRSFNDFKPALYSYLSIPFVYFIGLKATAVRMVSAIAGTISIIVLFFILKLYIKNKWLRLVIFLILSMQPWRLHFSRNAFETNLSAMFFCAGSYFLLTSKSKIKSILSVVLFALSAYSYHSARLSAPLLIIFWLIDPILLLKRKIKFEYKKIFYLLALMVLCVPIFLINNSALLLTRFRQENVFNHFYPYAPNEILNPISFVYYFLGIISGHIFSYISPINFNLRVYDWVRMSPQFIPGMGMLGWLEGVLLLWGFVYAVGNIYKSYRYRFIFYWMIAGIAPAAATWTWYHPLRSLNIFPAVEILVALGIRELFLLIKKYWSNKYVKVIYSIGLGLLIMMTLSFTINNEIKYSAVENSGEYQPGGFKEGMPFMASIQNNYQQVIIDSPHAQSYIFLVFYSKYDPSNFQKYADLRPKPGVEGNLNFNFDKYVFRKVNWPDDYKLKNTLFWTRIDITDAEVLRVPGAKIERKIPNVFGNIASIITTE